MTPEKGVVVSVENTLCEGTRAVPAAASDGGEAQAHSAAADRGSSGYFQRNLLRWHKKHRQIEFPLGNGRRALLIELLSGYR